MTVHERAMWMFLCFRSMVLLLIVWLVITGVITSCRSISTFMLLHAGLFTFHNLLTSIWTMITWQYLVRGMSEVTSSKTTTLPHTWLMPRLHARYSALRKKQSQWLLIGSRKEWSVTGVTVKLTVNSTKIDLRNNWMYLIYIFIYFAYFFQARQ